MSALSRIRRSAALRSSGYPTSFTDVALLLMIAYALQASSVSDAKSVDEPTIDLPRPSQEGHVDTGVSDATTVHVTVTEEEDRLAYFYEGKPAERGALLERLQTDTPTAVVIRAEGSLPYDLVLDLMHLVSSSGAIAKLAYEPQTDGGER